MGDVVTGISVRNPAGPLYTVNRHGVCPDKVMGAATVVALAGADFVTGVASLERQRMRPEWNSSNATW